MFATRRSFLKSAAFSAGCLRGADKRLPQESQTFTSLESTMIGGVEIRLSNPPKPLYNRADLGILLNNSMSAQRVHVWPRGREFCGEARAAITPAGDYLLMFAAGPHHYGSHRDKVNDMISYRSKDRGKTWTGPKVAWELPYNQHGFVPLTPRGTKTIYAFGTEPRPDVFDGVENAAIGYRRSDDDGRSWSAVTLIRPRNDPDFQGMFVMRMCEIDRGSWILAPHLALWEPKPLRSWLYILRSDDRGTTWTLLPAARPQGWTEPQLGRLEEGRPIALGNGRVLLMARTAEGHLWKLTSDDDGKTWSDPGPTPLVHPSAPPMLFHLNDGKTLAAFHHNRYHGVVAGTASGNNGMDRSELWVSTSRDGESWSEPRFVFANSAQPGSQSQSWNWSVSYIDMFADRGDLHLFVSHQHRQVLHVAFNEKDLGKLPTRGDLGKLI